MPITPTNPFKGRQYPGEVIVLCVRWYLRYPLAYQHVSEILAERGVEVDPSCIWRWVQAYAPELNKRCRPHLKPTNKSYRTDETYIKVKGSGQISVPRCGLNWPDYRVFAHGQAGYGGGQTLLP
jgi:transposase-like protein